MEEGEDEIWEIDIPQGEIVGEEGIGNRIALNKMDWDLISAVDILALFTSRKDLCHRFVAQTFQSFLQLS